MEEKNAKKFLISRAIVFESGRKNCQNADQDIFIGSQCVMNHP